MADQSRTFTKTEQKEAREALLRVLKPGDPVYVIQRHVARSGMMRHLSAFVIDEGKPWDITHLVAKAMGDRLYFGHHNYLKVGGAGMDMHFHLVYSLSRVLFREGHPCTGERGCPSNDHSNDYGTAQHQYFEEHPEDREATYAMDSEESSAAHARMRAYIEHRLSTDLGYDSDRMHSDGGYALRKVTF